jgi:choline dehydrogenase
MEVILAARATHTAELLQLSGIGQSAPLESLGVEVVAGLPGVGQNFQDHWGVTCYYPCTFVPFSAPAIKLLYAFNC